MNIRDLYRKFAHWESMLFSELSLHHPPPVLSDKPSPTLLRGLLLEQSLDSSPGMPDEELYCTIYSPCHSTSRILTGYAGTHSIITEWWATPQGSVACIWYWYSHSPKFALSWQRKDSSISFYSIKGRWYPRKVYTRQILSCGATPLLLLVLDECEGTQTSSGPTLLQLCTKCSLIRQSSNLNQRFPN